MRRRTRWQHYGAISRRIELRRLAIAYDLEKGTIAEELAQANIAKDKARIAAATKRLADLEVRRNEDTKLNQRASEGPYAAYRRQLDELDINDQLDAIKVDSLRRLQDELADSATAALGLSGALGDVVGSLIRIGIQRRILGGVDKFEPVSSGCEVDHAEEATGQLVVACGDSSVDLEVAEHALDAVALFVERPVMLNLHSAV